MASVVITFLSGTVKPTFKTRGKDPVKATPNLEAPAGRKRLASSLDCLVYLAHCQLQGVEQTVASLLELEGRAGVTVDDVGWRLIDTMAMVAASRDYEVTEEVGNMCRVIFALAKETLLALTGIEGFIAFLNMPNLEDREKKELVVEAILFDRFGLMGNLTPTEKQLLADACADPWTGYYLTALMPRLNPPAQAWLGPADFQLRVGYTIPEIAAHQTYLELEMLKRMI